MAGKAGEVGIESAIDIMTKTKISRRKFTNLILKWGSAVLLGGAVFDDDWITLFKYPRAVASDISENWTYSTCSFCAVGCGVWVGTKDGKINAVKGVGDHPVNFGYLCVKGIYQYQTTDTDKRGTSPLLRNLENNKLKEISWEKALDFLSSRLDEFISKHGPDSIAIYHGSQMLLEEYYIISKLASGCIGTKNIDVNARLCSLAAVEGFQSSFGESATPGNYKDVEKADCIIIVGHNPAENHPVLFYRLKKAKNKTNPTIPTIIVVDPRKTPTTEIADYHLPLQAGTDSFLFNSILNVIIKEDLIDAEFIQKYTDNYPALVQSVQEYHPEKAAEITKIPADTIREIAIKYGQSSKALIMWSVGVNHKIDGTRLVNTLNNLSLVTGNIGRKGTGPLYMEGQGSSPGPTGSITALPGGRDYDDEEDRIELAEHWEISPDKIPREEGIITTNIWDEIEAGKVKALWVIGTNPLLSFPDLNRFKKSINKLELLVVQDCYHDTSTAVSANLYLPAAMWSEKTGSVVNSERRVNLVNKINDPPGRAKPDWEIIKLLGDKLGCSKLFNYSSAEEIFEEWRQVSAGTKKDMQGINYDKIRKEMGVQYPCASIKDKGTPRLYEDYEFPLPNGRAKLIPFDTGFGPAEETDEEYPYLLLTGRVLQLWMTNTKTRLSPELMSKVAGPYVEISPGDADEIGVKNFEQVELSSRRGKIKIRVWITDSVIPGHIFVPFHFKEPAINILTANKVDPYSKEPALKSLAINMNKIHNQG